jgi:hypothetical protein
MTVAVAFKTKQPSLIADYLAARESMVYHWRATVDAFKESLGGREIVGTGFFDGGFAVTGYRAEKYGEDLPAGWRFDGAKKDVVPAKRTPEGKKLAAFLGELELPGNSYPGCPDILFAEGFSIFPRVEKIGDDYFLTLSKAPLDKPANAVDPEIWEPVKLSAYHAAIEDAEAAVKA